jgi:hypothetical protein
MSDERPTARRDDELRRIDEMRTEVASKLERVAETLLRTAHRLQRPSPHKIASTDQRQKHPPACMTFNNLRPTPAVPPTVACFLLDLFLSKADRKAIPGDLQEEFRANLAKYGPRGARLWFWGETVRTVAIRNLVCRWILAGGLMRLGDWIFRQIGS